MNFTSVFLLIWSICSLVPANKESFLFLFLNSFSELKFVPWSFYALSYGFSGFDTTLFHIFLRIGQFFMFFSRFFTLSLYCQSTYYIIGVQNNSQLNI